MTAKKRTGTGSTCTSSKATSKKSSRKKSSTSAKKQPSPKKGKGGVSTTSPKPKRKRALGRRMWDLTKNWGDDKNAFLLYLKKLKDSSEFMSEGKVRFLLLLKPCYRRAIYKHLGEIDPEGLKELRIYKNKLAAAKRFEKKVLPLQEAVAEMDLAIAQAHYEEEGFTSVRYVPATGVLQIVALCRAAGYSKKEVCEELQLEPQIVNQVTSEMVAMTRKRMPEAIVLAADKKVLRDLIEGDVGKSTNTADLIALRRRKLQLDLVDKERDNEKPPSPTKTASDAEELEDLFGTGKPIDVKPEED